MTRASHSRSGRYASPSHDFRLFLVTCHYKPRWHPAPRRAIDGGMPDGA